MSDERVKDREQQRVTTKRASQQVRKVTPTANKSVRQAQRAQTKKEQKSMRLRRPVKPEAFDHEKETASDARAVELHKAQALRDVGNSESTRRSKQSTDRTAEKATEMEQAASCAAKVIDLAALQPVTEPEPTPEPEPRKRSANSKYASDEERQAARRARWIERQIAAGKTLEQILAREAAQRRANTLPPNLVRVFIPD